MSQSSLAQLISGIARSGEPGGVEASALSGQAASALAGDEEKAVAWLWNITVDTAMTDDELIEMGFSAEVVQASVALSLPEGRARRKAVRGNALASSVDRAFSASGGRRKARA